MAFADGATIVGLSLGVSVGVEVLLWLWLYRTRSFEAMKAAVEKTRKKGARDPRRPGRGARAATVHRSTVVGSECEICGEF